MLDCTKETGFLGAGFCDVFIKGNTAKVTTRRLSF